MLTKIWSLPRQKTIEDPPWASRHKAFFAFGVGLSITSGMLIAQVIFKKMAPPQWLGLDQRTWLCIGAAMLFIGLIFAVRNRHS